tara:strand:+ start:52067 stop:53332 length:1266 start_codon:yes stop_codon:yes gene_type:complete
MNWFRPIYLFIIQPVLFFITIIALPFHKKIRKGFGLRLRFRFPAGSKDSYPIWFHCSSGEFEYAKSVIRELKQKYPQQKILVTYFSPTYLKNIESHPDVDFCCPLPWDLPGPMRSFIKHFRPKTLLIARTDLWPECLYQCQKYNVKTALFSCTKSSIKISDQILSAIHFHPYQQLNQIFCVSSQDQENIQSIAPNTPTDIVGDTRFDQAFYRVETENNPIHHAFFTGSTPILIMGSSWKQDEEAIIPAVAKFIRDGRMKLVIAPHEPTKSHIDELIQRIEKLDLKTDLFIDDNNSEANVLIINTVGILADLYKKTQLAFVGGSFKGSVHSVMEPLVTGNLVFVGPYYRNNREAIDFSTKNTSIENLNMVHTLNNGTELEDLIPTLLESDLQNLKQPILNETQKNKGSALRLIDQLLVKKYV